MDPVWYGASHQLELPGLAAPITTDVAKITAIWAVEAALIAGILLVVILDIAIFMEDWQKEAVQR